MSKSLGNFFTIRDLVAKGYSGAEIRYVLLQAHYRSKLSFSFEGLADARKSIRYLREFRLNMTHLPDRPAPSEELERIDELRRAADERFRAAMDDDLNASAAIAQIRGFCKEAYGVCTARASGEAAVEQVDAWDTVFGVVDGEAVGASEEGASDAGGFSEGEIEERIRARNAARAAKDFGEADRIRDELLGAGIVIKDSPEGTVWHREV